MKKSIHIPGQNDLFSPSGSRDIDVTDGRLILYPQVIEAGECGRLFDQLMAETPWQQDHIHIYGKQVKTPRLSAWYGDRPYRYSGIELKPRSLSPLLEALKQRMQVLTDENYNSALLNLYRDGTDSMSWHSDDEAELGQNPAIASLNLGATRRFRLRRKDDHKQTRTLDLSGGDVLLMAGPLQHFWQHSVPKTKKTVGPRINLTFRLIRA